MKLTAHAYDLLFKRPAGTSRGVLRHKRTWFLIAENEQGRHYGECGVFAGLSADDRPNYEAVLRESMAAFERGALELEDYLEWPSIVFGWEMLLASIQHATPGLVYPSSFHEGEAIGINGLIWMGDKDYMLEQIDALLERGFGCLKMKIGAIDFDTELDILHHIRQHHAPDILELRVDANGAFAPEEASEKLKRLSEYNLHSIEQPIAPGHDEAMAKLCSQGIIDIALDEALIGVYDTSDKTRLLEEIGPKYIILKPSLVGGWSASDEWISIAEGMGIGWWATSALESNIGLNAICQWAAAKSPKMVQGLGTGSLYTNNITSPLEVASGSISYRQDQSWDYSLIDAS